MSSDRWIRTEIIRSSGGVCEGNILAFATEGLRKPTVSFCHHHQQQQHLAVYEAGSFFLICSDFIRPRVSSRYSLVSSLWFVNIKQFRKFVSLHQVQLVLNSNFANLSNMDFFSNLYFFYNPSKCPLFRSLFHKFHFRTLYSWFLSSSFIFQNSLHIKVAVYITPAPHTLINLLTRCSASTCSGSWVLHLRGSQV
jgi:hypothetical protein